MSSSRAQFFGLPRRRFGCAVVAIEPHTEICVWSDTWRELSDAPPGRWFLPFVC
jgi:hypothetical protein